MREHRAREMRTADVISDVLFSSPQIGCTAVERTTRFREHLNRWLKELIGYHVAANAQAIKRLYTVNMLCKKTIEIIDVCTVCVFISIYTKSLLRYIRELYNPVLMQRLEKQWVQIYEDFISLNHKDQQLELTLCY